MHKSHFEAGIEANDEKIIYTVTAQDDSAEITVMIKREMDDEIAQELAYIVGHLTEVLNSVVRSEDGNDFIIVGKDDDSWM